jgi:DNA-binding MarR family transcriptional regulator
MGGAGTSGRLPPDLVHQVAEAAEALVAVCSRAPSAMTPRLSAHQYRALLVVHRQGGINLTGLAEAIDAGLPAASRLCDRLEAAGLLQRGLAPVSRREIELTLTRAGRLLVEETLDQRRRHLADVLARMPPDGRQGLLTGLRSFAEAWAGAEQGDAPG